MSEDSVRLDIEGRVAVVTLDSPPLNVFDVAMRDGLIAALSAIGDIPDVRVMVLRAEGRHFSAGADLAEFGSASSILEGRRIRWDRDPWIPLRELPIPTVAALHGITLGSGLEMALLCDFRLADPGSTLGLPETKLAMLPAAGGTQSLTRSIGSHAALPLVASATSLGAEEAFHRGLVHQVTLDVDGRARQLADQLVAIPPATMAAARRSLRAAGDLPLEQGLALERRLARVAALQDAPARTTHQ